MYTDIVNLIDNHVGTLRFKRFGKMTRNYQREGTLFHEREAEWSSCVHHSMIPSWRSLYTGFYCTSTLTKEFNLYVSPLLTLCELANELGTSLLQSRRFSTLSGTALSADPQLSWTVRTRNRKSRMWWMEKTRLTADKRRCFKTIYVTLTIVQPFCVCCGVCACFMFV